MNKAVKWIRTCYKSNCIYNRSYTCVLEKCNFTKKDDAKKEIRNKE